MRVRHDAPFRHDDGINVTGFGALRLATTSAVSSWRQLATPRTSAYLEAERRSSKGSDLRPHLWGS